MTPCDCSLPDSSVHGISQARIGSGLPFPSPGDLPGPGIEPVSSSLAGGFFTPKAPQAHKANPAHSFHFYSSYVNTFGFCASNSVDLIRWIMSLTTVGGIITGSHFSWLEENHHLPRLGPLDAWVLPYPSHTPHGRTLVMRTGHLDPCIMSRGPLKFPTWEGSGSSFIFYLLENPLSHPFPW